MADGFTSVVVKTAAPGHEASRDGLIREYKTLKMQSVAASKYIRTMYDVVSDPMELNDEKRNDYPGLVLEWFDTTLQDIPPERYRHNLALLHAIILAVLSSSATFHSENLVNTELGISVLPFAMRAPEVWRGLACLHQSEVWALAAMLLVWMKPGILGTSAINGYITGPIWSIAKLMQLFPRWKGPPSDRDFRRDEFEIAEMLSREPDSERQGEKRVKVATLEEEMQTMRIPVVLRVLLRVLLIPEPEVRPSASEALASKEYQALRKAALARTEAEG
ncbi:hypothetical protein LTR29_017516 [Friedmanniomyces endolithicus]|nr:hypothetical protein LTS09_017769 [Friedmanniomyces endolithicus]KAK0927965.1 hypothetical protein LTR29_017516 [Friedmanniomyces endolithicus]